LPLSTPSACAAGWSGHFIQAFGCLNLISCQRPWVQVWMAHAVVMLLLLVKLFTWPMAAFQGIILWWLWPSMAISLPSDGLFQDVRQLVYAPDRCHALLRAQAAAGAGCLSSMTCTDDKILCCQFMLWLFIQHARALLSDTCVIIMHSMHTPCIWCMTKPSNLVRGLAQLLEGLLKNVRYSAFTRWANIMLHKCTKHVEIQPIHSHAYTWFCWASLAKYASSRTLVNLHMCV